MLKHNVYIHIYENVTKTLQMHYRYVYIYGTPQTNQDLAWKKYYKHMKKVYLWGVPYKYIYIYRYILDAT